MSELDDDIARGCLPNGEPIEGRWGVGPWSDIPDAPQQEPDPWEEALSAARAEGYREGLSELARKFEPDEIVRGIEVQIVADQLKSAYEKGSDDGNETDR